MLTRPKNLSTETRVAVPACTSMLLARRYPGAGRSARQPTTGSLSGQSKLLNPCPVRQSKLQDGAAKPATDPPRCNNTRTSGALPISLSRPADIKTRSHLILRHPREYQPHAVGLHQAVPEIAAPLCYPRFLGRKVMIADKSRSSLGYLLEAALPIVAPLVTLGLMLSLLPFV
jgi:hypothetical protein